MRKTTNISPDKTGTLKEFKRIKFDLNPINYKCFISNDHKKAVSLKQATPHNDCFQNPEYSFDTQRPSKASELRIPYIRKNSIVNPCNYCQQHFNYQVLLMKYEADQVYTDSIKNNTDGDRSFDSKSAYSDNSEESEIVASCLKMLAEETDSESMQGFSRQQQVGKSFLSSSQSQTPNYYPSYRQPSEMNSFTVDLSKVVEDGRTTVMIRNIPNKYTESLLLDLFNKNHKKKIDFFYLPIDYKNNCNVGYAFLNFTEPKYLEEFYNQFHSKKWKLFNSEKVCHICYARIQGASQLSHHFEPNNRKLKEAPK